jgi:uncharacterized protein (DUF2141 family)
MCARVSLAIVLAWMLASCATPIAPTGGEADRTPPELIRSVPSDGSVGFTDTRIELLFNKYIDLQSFRTSLRFEPNLNIQYKISWKGTKARITLEEPLPPNTTVVLVLEKGLRDVRGNQIPAAIRLAYSSGDRIDNGALQVRLAHPETGKRVDLVDVFLYRGDTRLDEPATYTSQSDTGGTVIFKNLPADTFRIVAVADVNRNRILDLPREAGFPFRDEQIVVMQDSTLQLGGWFVARTDTVQPVLEGMGLMSPDRLRLRFSKRVDRGSLRIASAIDTLQLQALHPEPQDRSVWFYHAERPLSVGQRYSPFSVDISDSLGNRSTWDDIALDAEVLPDTIRTRFLGMIPTGSVNPDQTWQMVFNRVSDFRMVMDSLSVIADRQSFDSIRVTTELNRILISPITVWPEGVTLTASLLDPISGVYQRPIIRVNRTADRGDLLVSLPDSTTKHIVTLHTAQGVLVRSLEGTDVVMFNDVPIGSYVVSAYVDRNDNQRFDTGTVVPFVAPEIYMQERSVQIKAGFESELRFR